MFKINTNSSNENYVALLRRLHLYHPSLDNLMLLSNGSLETVETRSKKFSEILNDIVINGVWKRTGPSRLLTLDDWILNIIEKYNSNEFKFLDIGASDGCTTYDLVISSQNRLKVSVFATILEMQLRLFCYRKGYLKYYLDYNANPFLIQIGAFGILFEKIKSKEGYLLNPLIKILKYFFKTIRLQNFLYKDDDILLINPIARNVSNISWLEQDLFLYNSSLIDTFDLIRCSNVLNLGYFDGEKIKNAFTILSKYLKKDGLLLVSRAVDESGSIKHTATVWKKSGDKLIHYSDLNGGSEIKNLINTTI